MSQVLFREESYQIIGACFEVHREMGNGFLESVYHRCLKHEFHVQGIPAVSEPTLDIFYKGMKLEDAFQPDFVCFGKIILELKAVRAIDDVHRAQVHNYLKATTFQLGILINFGTPSLMPERIINLPPNLLS